MMGCPRTQLPKNQQKSAGVEGRKSASQEMVQRDEPMRIDTEAEAQKAEIRAVSCVTVPQAKLTLSQTAHASLEHSSSKTHLELGLVFDAAATSVSLLSREGVEDVDRLGIGCRSTQEELLCSSARFPSTLFGLRGT